MFETQLFSLLNLAAIASTDIASCEKYIRQLQGMKATIQRTAGVGLVGITQVNEINLLVGKLERRKRTLETEQEFTRRDHLREEAARKQDEHKIRQIVDESHARKSYRK